MTWTQGQPIRGNQSPFIDPESEDNKTVTPPPSRTYTKPYNRRNDAPAQRQQQPPRHAMKQADVAATFTQEGLQTFSMIFSSAVEAAIAKSLPDIVERSVERKFHDVVIQVRDDIAALTNDLFAKLSDEIDGAVQAQFEKILERIQAFEAVQHPPHHVESADGATHDDLPDAVTIEESVDEIQTGEEAQILNEQSQTLPAEEAADTSQVMHGYHLNGSSPDSLQNDAKGDRRSRAAYEVGLVIETMKRVGRPIRTSELQSLIEEVRWGSNPSVKMTTLMNQSAGRIRRAGRGLYTYTPVDSDSLDG